ncbi:hypothetical protein NliqN6_1015 [Naganishia liquefaciens]|uniref:Auxin efflux carrier n=1 Tax=Naganishia liquefaciens TaxID=104408 RepID=A0A8H3TP56_9TREE|nr:hypothetical protein NliqN6_1015 [Naganishia liquefaciens]
MTNVGNYIYSGFVPLLKMAITIACGFALAKKGMFPAAAARGASFVAMNVSLPALIFSAVVSAFSKDNIASLGPLCLNAIVYQFIGLALGWLIRECLYVPADFQWGILAATTWSNWGNLPIAVITTVATQSPFDKNVDPTLGTAYVAVFTLVYNITFFGMGGCKICAWDFRPGAAEVLPIKQRWARRRQAFRRLWGRARGTMEARRSPTLSLSDLPYAETPPQISTLANPELEKSMPPQDTIDDKLRPDAQDIISTGYANASGSQAPVISRYRSHQEVVATVQALHDTIQLAPVSSRVSRNRVIIPGREYDVPDDVVPKIRDSQEGPGRRPPRSRQSPALSTNAASAPAPANHPASEHSPQAKGGSASWYRTPLNILKLTLTPPSISLFFALPISLVQPLKALFVNVEGWSGGRIPFSPDGKPPLNWLLDTASFLGQICIPLGLILLGASFARLDLPKPLWKLPIAAIVAVTVAKMVILPVIGVLMTESLSNHTSLYPKDQKMLRFVAMFLSGTPSALNSLIMTMIYSPDGRADTLSAFLALQYVFMFISSTALAAVAFALIA